MVVEYSHVKEGNWTLFSPLTEINSKWIKDLNVTPESIKLLKENTGENSLTLVLATMFLDMIPKAKAIKAKISGTSN